MVMLYLSIPLMILALSIALVPLVWAMRQDQQARDGAVIAAVGSPQRTARNERLAA